MVQSSARWRLPAAAALLLAASVALAARAQAPAPAGISSARIDVASLLDDLRTLSADAMEGRAIGTAGGARARRFVLARLQASGVTPFGASYEQPIALPARGTTPARAGANVVGVIRGTTRPDRYLVMSAHFDHVGIRDGQIYNGADDNASGTAALFAIARHFSQHPLSSSLIIAAFDGEEEGLVGSRAFVRAPPVDRNAIVIDLNADMIARDPKDNLYVVGTIRQPTLKPIIDRLATTAPLHLLQGHEGHGTGEDWTEDSDHYAFMEAGIPALYFGVEDYAHLHKPSDDYETIDRAFYVHAVETLIDALIAFDAS
jgi:Zn-dependent M28 family amino/carboxypeptidase